MKNLLSGIDALVQPNYQELNEKKQRLLHAVLCALDGRGVGWEQLEEILSAAICEEIGDKAFAIG